MNYLERKKEIDRLKNLCWLYLILSVAGWVVAVVATYDLHKLAVLIDKI